MCNALYYSLTFFYPPSFGRRRFLLMVLEHFLVRQQPSVSPFFVITSGLHVCVVRQEQQCKPAYLEIVLPLCVYYAVHPSRRPLPAPSLRLTQRGPPRCQEAIRTRRRFQCQIASLHFAPALRRRRRRSRRRRRGLTDEGSRGWCVCVCVCGRRDGRTCIRQEREREARSANRSTCVRLKTRGTTVFVQTTTTELCEIMMEWEGNKQGVAGTGWRQEEMRESFQTIWHTCDFPPMCSEGGGIKAAAAFSAIVHWWGRGWGDVLRTDSVDIGSRERRLEAWVSKAPNSQGKQDNANCQQ